MHNIKWAGGSIRPNIFVESYVLVVTNEIFLLRIELLKIFEPIKLFKIDLLVALDSCSVEVKPSSSLE
jgi:hypothetical protein